MIGHRQQLLILCLCFLSLVTPGVDAFDLNDLKKQFEGSNKAASESLKIIDQLRGKVSTDDEIEIGAKLTSGLLGASPLVADTRLQHYVNDVGYWVAAQSERNETLAVWRHSVTWYQCICSSRWLYRGDAWVVSIVGKRGPTGRCAGP